MYLKVPFDTLMDMPVYVRKFWIDKYVADNDKSSATPDSKTVDGASINTYAQLEQDNQTNSKR